KTNRDLVGLLVLGGEREAGGERERLADEGVAAHEVHAWIEDVHRAAAAARGAGLLAVELGHHLARRRAGLDGVDVVAVAGNDVVVATLGHLEHAGRDRLLTYI